MTDGTLRNDDKGNGTYYKGLHRYKKISLSSGTSEGD